MIDLRGIFGNTLGDTQFKQLMVVSAFLLLFCVGITCISVTERVLLTRECVLSVKSLFGRILTVVANRDTNSGMLHMFRVIWNTLLHLPKNIWAV